MRSPPLPNPGSNRRRGLRLDFAHPAAMRATPFAIFIAFVTLSSITHDLASQGAWDLRWLNAPRAVLVATALAYFWRGYGELLVPRGVPLRHWLLAIAAGVVVFAIWIRFDHGWAVFGDTRGYDPGGHDGGLDLALASLRLAELALIVPVMEELFWRSFLLRWLDAREFSAADPRRASPRAFVLTAALFASEHALWFAGLIAGLAYNWLYIRTGNLWVPIASHAVTNGALGIWVIATASWHLW